MRGLGIQTRAVVQAQGPGLEVHLHRAAEIAEEIQQLADVGDVRHTQQAHRLSTQQGGAKHRQNGILVGGRDDPAAERRTAVHDKVGHG